MSEHNYILPSSLLDSSRILLSIEGDNKKRVFEEVGLAFENSGGPSRGQVLKHLLERERLGSTIISAGVAVPHARITNLKVPLAAFIRMKEDVLYDSPDSKVRYMFFLLAPDKADGTHLKILSLMSRLLTNPEFIEQADKIVDGAELLELIRDWEKQQNLEPEEQETSQ